MTIKSTTKTDFQMENKFKLLVVKSETNSLSTIDENKENEKENYIDWNKKLEEAERESVKPYVKIQETTYSETWTPAEKE